MPTGSGFGYSFINNTGSGLRLGSDGGMSFGINNSTILALYAGSWRFPVVNVTLNDSTTGNRVLAFSADNTTSNSPTNHLRIRNSTTGSTPTLQSDSSVLSDVSLNIAAKGTGSINLITGSVAIGKASPNAKLDVSGSVIVTGSLNVTQNITGSRMYLSGSIGTVSGSTLILYGSGSTNPIFTVQGSQGELFSVTDNLSGSLFSVNDISGLPVLEAFSDNTVLLGSYQDPMLITTTKLVTTASGAFNIYSLPTASYDAAFYEYSIRSGSNARAGSIMAIQSGSSVNFTETTTTDFGSTAGFAFTVLVSGASMILTGSASTSGWTIKTIIRSI